MVDQIKLLSEKISISRAKLLARDQVGKLNGMIAKAQSLDIGQDLYLWFTARDEKVRGNPGGKYPKAIPSHWIMDSLLFSWIDYGVYSADGGTIWKARTAKMETSSPGIPLLCRCTAGAYWGAMINYVDNKIEAGEI
jgi:uncharacterized protein with gpF-like domain